MSTAFPVNDNPRFVIVATTNGQTTLTIPFPFQQAADIRIIKEAVNGAETELARPANFTLTGAGNPEGGSATLVTAARAGELYTVLGNTIPTRTENVTRGGKFNSAAMDDDLDRLTLMVQELRRDVAQAFRARYGSEPGQVTIGAEGTIPVWDEAGNLVEGPSAAAIDAIETALDVEAGRALVHGTGGSDPYAAGNRKIAGLADATEPDEAITKAQLYQAESDIDPPYITSRVAKLEQGWLTGDVKFSLDDAAQTGWLFAQGGFIGDASSNASVRANDDTEALFAFIWARRALYGTTIKTSAGAASTFGANAAADFAAHKQIELPDLSARFPRAAGGALTVGTKQANQNLAHTHSATSGSAGAHNHANGAYNRLMRPSVSNDTGTTHDTNANEPDIKSSAAMADAPDHSHSVTVNSAGGSEARPDSFVLRALIRM